MRAPAFRAVRCSVLIGGLLALSAPAFAQGVLLQQKPVLRSPARLPPSVPSGYLLTRGGFFHPSCVITMHSGDTLGQDRVIRGTDGKERTRVAPCAYPRFSAQGALISPAAFAPLAPTTALELPPAHAAKPVYDGWILDFAYDGDVKPGNTIKLSTDVIVPLAPTKVVGQDVAFFNSIETATQGGDILQPVLDFGGYGKNWAIESEHCCLDNNDMQTDAIEVAPGDLIRGVVTGTNCDAKGACSAWTVDTKDITSGEDTALNTSTATGVMNEIDPAVLETYDVSSCDMLPANGEITYFNHHVTNADGQDMTFTYKLNKETPMSASFPTTCGYRGEQANGGYTLFFGMNPTSVGGAGGGAGQGAGGSGGVTASGGAGGTLGSSGASAAGSAGVLGGASGAAGSSGSSAVAGSSPGGGAAGVVASAGSASSLGGAPASAGSAGAASGGEAPHEHTANDAAGCSCRVGAPMSGARFAPLALLLGVAQLVRRRRQRG